MPEPLTRAPVGKSGRGSLLNRPSCSLDEPVRQGTELMFHKMNAFSLTVAPEVIVCVLSCLLVGFVLFASGVYVCVCVYVRACVRACVRVCVCVCVSE